MRAKVTLFFIVSTVFLSAEGLASLRHQNLTFNSSFEGSIGWQYKYGRTGNSARTDGMSHSGRYSLRLHSQSSSRSEGYWSDPIQVTPGTRYIAESHVYRQSGHAPYYYVKYFSSDGKEIQSSSKSLNIASRKWTKVTLETRAPKNSAYARLIPYISINRTGVSYFDDIVFRRSPDQGVLPNSNFEVDSIGSGYPVGWSRWAGARGVASVAYDPVDSDNKVMRIVDGLASMSANAEADAEYVEGGINYEISADVYLKKGSDPMRLYARFYDKDGNRVFSRSKDSSNQSGQWQTVRFSMRVPIEAVSAKTIVYCSIARQCDAYVDNVFFDEYWVDVNTFYVSPEGNGSGFTKDDPASPYGGNLDGNSFWNFIQRKVSSYPVKVIFTEGDYAISRGSDKIKFEACGHADHRIVLEAESPHSVSIFDKDYYSCAQLFSLKNCSNMSIRNINFTSKEKNYHGSCAYNKPEFKASQAIRIYAGLDEAYRDANNLSRGVIIDGASFRELSDFKYAAVSPVGPVEDVSIINSEFIRGGGPGSSYHHVYAAGPLRGLDIERSYFEDASGDHIKLRRHQNQTTITENTFYSTGSYRGKHTSFVRLAAHNNGGRIECAGTATYDENGDLIHCTGPIWGLEWFGKGYRIADNKFQQAVVSGVDPRPAIRITHKGFNPKDNQGVVREHLLDSSRRNEMSDTSIQNINVRRSILASDYHLDIGDCDDGWCIYGNSYSGVDAEVSMWLTARHNNPDLDPQPSPSGSGVYDISNLFD